MAKPTVLPRWATVGAAIVTPSSGKLDTGWVVREKPPAQYFNWYMNIVYHWCLWLNGLFDSSGNLTMDNNASITTSGTGGIAISGSGNLTMTSGSATITAGDLTLGAGIYKHGPRGLTIPASSFSGNLATLVSNGTYITTTGTLVHAWIPLEVGKRIVSVTVYYDNGGTTTPHLQRYQPSAGSPTDVWTGTADATASGIESQASGTLNHTIAAGYAYQITMQVTASTCKVYGVVVTYDQP